MRRPINPVIPYPHEAIQHTRCVLALSMITVAISFLKPENAGTAWRPWQTSREGQPLDRPMCGRHAEAQALRRREARSGCPVPYPCRACRGHSGGCRRRHPLDTMGHRNVGRAHLSRRRPEHLPRLLPGALHWHNLLKTLTTLCNALENVDPKIAEIGTRVYERAA